MTPIQHQIYQFICEFIQEHGYSPALREIAVGVGISPKSKSFISETIKIFISSGLLRKNTKHKSRNIEMIQANTLIPFVGRIAAGVPIEVFAEEEFIDLQSIFQGDRHFILEVKGSSMMDEGIWDGDKIICRKQNFAKNGDVVVALIDNANATLKKISYSSSEEITLIPANINFKSETYATRRIQVQGIFVGLIRLPL